MSDDMDEFGSGNATCDAIGHDEHETYSDDDYIYYVCERCGAELEDSIES